MSTNTKTATSKKAKTEALEKVLSTSVSYFINHYGKAAKRTTLKDWLSATRNPQSEEAKKQANIIQQIRSEPSKKKTLTPYLWILTPGAHITEDQPRNEKHAQPSGLLQLDVDVKHNRELVSSAQELKRAISTHPAVFYCGISTSAGGCWALIQVEDPHDLRAHYEQVQKEFEQAGLVIDNKGGNATDARYFATDARPAVRYDFEQYRRKAKKPTPAKRYAPRQITAPKSSGKKLEKDLDKAARQVEAKGVDITATYEAWFSIGAALAYELGEAGREYFHTFSQFHQEYDQEQADKQFSHCMKGRYGYTKNTVFHYLEQAGILIKEAETPQKATQTEAPSQPTAAPSGQTEPAQHPPQPAAPAANEYTLTEEGYWQPLTDRAAEYEFERMAAKNPALERLRSFSETGKAPTPPDPHP